MSEHKDDELAKAGRARKRPARGLTLPQVHRYIGNGWPEITDLPQFIARTVTPPEGRAALLKSSVTPGITHESRQGLSCGGHDRTRTETERGACVSNANRIEGTFKRPSRFLHRPPGIT